MKTLCIEIARILKLAAPCALAVLMAASCSKSSGDALAHAGNLADSIASADAGGSVVVAAPDLDASFTIDDAELSLSSVGQDLFNVFAAQQLKKLSAKDITTVCDALRDSKGELHVILNSSDGESATFAFTPQQVIKLQRAKNSELNLGAARLQAVAVAEKMVPNPSAHSGAVRVDVSVAKSFLEYNIVWPKASAYDKYPQGVLTANYFNALKKQYQNMGGLAEPVIDMLTSMGIDGVRIVYSAVDSDKQLKQAFPWREIRLPIEEGKN